MYVSNYNYNLTLSLIIKIAKEEIKYLGSNKNSKTPPIQVSFIAYIREIAEENFISKITGFELPYETILIRIFYVFKLQDDIQRISLPK